ncbi:Dolichyl-diphosphooligosaccharide--protein glycosyltransferase subunit WBP1 [Radiomyces spectabilis]|uniref:Dolichyl-diphosphooligosaccharide--protein glycosyltransferase subunit WBP1 n=1 Tax=Radiomyces spectabilis TaxID=64574 RepID=UPI00221EA878|nr:Dolichyl-diphosphooligosaccharide--protein glycosyltransferase subunit WBP1 [Radiomyces spectabilis]KAI8384284.1 Dolichyl-diphosphooligosaccharide--protein glycosyltransferase subunit WBP1 [Radiomyces spectabilis]
MKLHSLLVLLCAYILALLAPVQAHSVTGNKVLVLLDDLAQKATYSRFWQSLTDRDYKLVFKTASEADATLYYFGERLYNHIIHFAPKAEILSQHGGIGNIQLVKFVNDGGNLLVAVDEDASRAVKDLASEFDVEYDHGNNKVFDHNALPHDIIAADDIVAPNTIIESDSVRGPVLYKGIGLFVGPTPLLNRVLTTGPDAFSADSYREGAKHEQIDLVASLQARNSARATFAGSLALFSDELYESSPAKSSKSHEKVSGNAAFISQLVEWTFQEKSVLKLVSHRHHRVNETKQPEWYRVKDHMDYILEVSEYKNRQWAPFKADDIQLEVIMLDPYIRTTMKQLHVEKHHHFGRFMAHVQLPDVYGVFTLRVNYKRAGLSYLLAEDVVAIRPFRHNEYPRFLIAAYPYYASVGSMIVGFLVFSIVWLSTWGTKEITPSKEKTQ